jgi:hypothetical protein
MRRFVRKKRGKGATAMIISSIEDVQIVVTVSL